jgi:hypothetical protein
VTLTEAHDAIRRGAEYGPVCEQVPEADREALAAWYVAEPGLPNLAGRKASRCSVPTGNPCGKCGGLMVRTGTCETCQSCGESSGGCG